MKRLISVVLTLLTFACISLSFSGCSGCNWELEIETQGDFLYTVSFYDCNGNRTGKERAVRSGIIIMGLSETGQDQETIVVPEYIAGLKVEELGYSKMWGNKGEWESEKLKKVFVPIPIVICRGIFNDCVNLERIILLQHDADYHKIEELYRPIFLTSYRRTEGEFEKDSFYYHSINENDCYFSNVTFVYNYENAPNDGYYWIDDCDYGSKIEYIPQRPYRNGFIFDGWYKQAECIEEWNFETDTLPEAEYTEENDEVYQETKLYAKWKRI